MLKIGQIAITGKVSGLWNKDNRTFEVKRGMTKNGKKYQIFDISVSSKDQEGNWTNGKGIKVMLWGETKVEHGSNIGLVGRLQPDNYENKDGKTVYGNMINAFDTDMFEPEAWDKKPKAEDDKPPFDTKEPDEIPSW